ncbi:Uncharacterised protein [uncultured archaeon]|nr:Uncharacterised protein [uncultured archaeon]
MGKVLIAYPLALEKKKPSNEDKVAMELTRHFFAKSFSVKRITLEPKKKLSVKDQFKNEKTLELKAGPSQLSSFDIVVLGTPIVGSLTSSPLVNAFIRGIPKKTGAGAKKQKFVLFSAGVLHGFELKKMQSLLSMKGIKPIDSESFTSMFDFDEKKLFEVKQFFERFMDKIVD